MVKIHRQNSQMFDKNVCVCAQIQSSIDEREHFFYYNDKDNKKKKKFCSLQWENIDARRKTKREKNNSTQIQTNARLYIHTIVNKNGEKLQLFLISPKTHTHTNKINKYTYS